jgi:hypothetical protein
VVAELAGARDRQAPLRALLGALRGTRDELQAPATAGPAALASGACRDAAAALPRVLALGGDLEEAGRRLVAVDELYVDFAVTPDPARPGAKLLTVVRRCAQEQLVLGASVAA